MGNLLYLVHRLPYPPNKGDKLRSFHLLRHLASRHRVFLGTFLDDPHDEAHVDTVRALCAGLHVSRLNPTIARWRSLGGLARGDALTLGYYRDPALAHWVRETTTRHAIEMAVVFSSSMAQYVDRLPGLEMLVDFVDVDSAKWTDYATARRWPMSWLYRREGERLLAYERSVAVRARHSFFVTDRETALFRRLAPESAASVEAMGNGVDSNYFSPDAQRASPYADGELALVFTGAMDYWPNADAVCWFAEAVLPALREAWPALRLHVVGSNPSPAVRRLAGVSITVTGTVPDVRPYLQHAAVVVAPLRLARGIQNKILEAMAMERPVVAASACVAALTGASGEEILTAADAGDFVRSISTLLSDAGLARRIGSAARRRVLQSYSWDANLSRIDPHLSVRLADGVRA